jgi:hypothetical protein
MLIAIVNVGIYVVDYEYLFRSDFIQKWTTNSDNISLSSSFSKIHQSIIFKYLDEDTLDFEGFDNKKGSSRLIVPNIVHLVYLKQPKIKFYQMISIFSIFLNQKPDRIYIHCDDCSFYGTYWKKINEVKSLVKVLKLHKVPSTDKIFGITNGWICQGGT